MKKYLSIIKAAWHGQMVYRINFFMHRIGNFFEIMAQIIIWFIIFQDNEVVRGYSLEEMITYIILGWLFMFITGNYGLEHKVSEDIRLGRMSNILIKPITYLKYITSLSIGRVSIAMTTAISMQILIFTVFHKMVIFNFEVYRILLIVLMLFFGYFIRLAFSILVGFAGFWTTEVKGIFVCFTALSKFFSGTFFPINLLPKIFVDISLSLPFVYTFYVPAQIYLGKMSLLEGIRGIGLEIVWLFILYLIIKFVWKKGLKKYESVGI